MLNQLFQLKKDQTGLLIVDVQEKLFPLCDRKCEVMAMMQKVIRGMRILEIPIVVSEQYPKGLGHTVDGIARHLPEHFLKLEKTSFSCLGNDACRNQILELPVTQWVVIGIEAHVCVLQTVKGLLSAKKQVVVLNDAITSRSVFDFSTAIAEMRDCGARISSAETVLFELLQDAKTPEFKAMSALIKQGAVSC